MARMMRNGQGGFMLVHNNVEVWNDYPNKFDGKYYITPDSNAEVITLPGYMSDDMVLEYGIIHGSGTGDYYVGNMGVDFDSAVRFFGEDGWDEWMYDFGYWENSRIMTSYACDYTLKYYIRVWNDGVEVKLGDTVVYTNSGQTQTLSNYYPILINNAVSGMKVYGVKLTNGNNVAFDCAVDANGLFDKVSNSYITTTGWTVGSDE